MDSSLIKVDETLFRLRSEVEHLRKKEKQLQATIDDLINENWKLIDKKKVV